MSTWTSYFVRLTLAVIFTIAAYGLYNIYLHPLRRYPGPKLWSAYRLPYVVRYIQGVLPYKVSELHRRYGPVVRIAPDELAFVDASAWQDIYGLGPDRKQNELDMMTFTPHEPGMEESFAGATFDVHARLRRIYAPAFSSTAIERVAGIFEQYANLLVSRLKTVMTENATNSNAPQSSIVDIHDWYNFVSFDILGDFAFGESFHCLQEARAHFFMKTIVPGIVAAAKMNQLERYGIYSALKPLIPASAMQAKIDIDTYVSELVDKRLEQTDLTRSDAFSFLERSELSRSALYQNAIIIVMAGSHTVTTTLTAATWFLCNHPEKLKRAQHEVRRLVTAAADISAKVVQQLPYLDAVIRETLRLVPGGAFGNPRWIRRKGGQVIAGVLVPTNTRCSIYHYAAYRCEEHFARPDDFVPERWLPDETPEACKDDNHKAYQPFNVGPRACIGKSFGNIQTQLILATMLWHFEFELARTDGNTHWIESLGAYPIWEKPPLMVRLTERRV